MLELDHLVYATPDLAATVAWFESATGVRPTPGGRHVGFGTRNELVALGPTSYLEIVGPDLQQDAPEHARPFGIDELPSARLVTWAVKADRLEQHLTRCAAQGLDLGMAIDMSRAKPDGSLLEWALTIPTSLDTSVRPVPFLIDWRGTQSPALTSAQGVSLSRMHATAEDADALRRDLQIVGVDLDVEAGQTTTLFADLVTPKGILRLR